MMQKKPIMSWRPHEAFCELWQNRMDAILKDTFTRCSYQTAKNLMVCMKIECQGKMLIDTNFNNLNLQEVICVPKERNTAAALHPSVSHPDVTG